MSPLRSRAIESPQINRVRDARAALLMTHPFFGCLALKMELHETTAIPTAGVDTRYLHFNPDFIDTLTQGELKGVIAHEVLHLALGHHARMGKRDHQRWNIACDYALNPLLVADSFILPKDALIDAQYAGMSADAIYARLPVPPPQAGKGKGKPGAGNGQPGAGQPSNAPGSGTPQAGQGWGDFTSPGPEGSAENNTSAREWAENAQEAAKAAQSAGKLPAHIKREVTNASAPKTDWRTLFRRFMTDQVKPRSTWSKPNKRFAPALYLPGTVREGLGEVVFIIDTSGSISPRVLGVFQAIANEIIHDVEPATAHVVYADADVNHVDSYEMGEEVTLKPVGGGGTDFRPAFEHVTREGWPVACAVYLTDLCGTFPDKAAEYPVLWLSYGAGGQQAPWGETVVMDE